MAGYRLSLIRIEESRIRIYVLTIIPDYCLKVLWLKDDTIVNGIVLRNTGGCNRYNGKFFSDRTPINTVGDNT